MRGFLYGASCLTLIAVPIAAHAAEEAVFAIPAGKLADALKAYAAQADLQLIFDADLVATRTSPAVEGRWTAPAALDLLLKDSGLEASRPRPGVVVIRIAQRQGGSLDDQVLHAADEPIGLEEIVVTGSLIRGAGDGPSPVIVFDRDAIDSSGHASVADMLQDLPQNFGGGSTADTQQVQSDGRATNTTRSTGVDLRGMGSNATLVLVNGRRMAGSGAKGDFADVSALPTAAIDRVDVLLDGASALYGSDAVGGVVNITLKRDYDGAETRVRVGSAQGGASERQLAHTMGWAGDDGYLLLSAEYHQRLALAGSQRVYTRSADLRELGGSDRRVIYAAPGNIVSSSLAPQYAIVPGPAPRFDAGRVNLGEPRAGFTLLPSQERRSIYGAAGWRVSDNLQFDLDFRYSRRNFEARGGAATSALTVTGANPYFASPTGAASHTIAYSFAKDLGPTRTDGMAESLGATIGAAYRFGGDWRAEAYGAFAREFGRTRTVNQLHSLFLNEALGRVTDNPETAFFAARDGYFNPYDPGTSSAAATRHVGSGFTLTKPRSDVLTANLQLDGTLLRLPAGPLKAAFGAQVRKESFAYSGATFSSRATPQAIVRPTFERDAAAIFGELRAPLAKGDAEGKGSLELSIAGRLEHYETAGTTSDPKLGLVWKPLARTTLRASYGTSFRAPTLAEVHENYVVSPAALPRPGGGTNIAIIQQGGNLDLKPETATTWTAGFQFEPVDRLVIEANWFDTNYENRIGQPAAENLSRVLFESELAPFVTLVSPTVSAADRALIQGYLSSPAYVPVAVVPVEGFGAIVDARYRNAASLRVRGADFSVRYRHDLGANRLSYEVSGTYLADYTRKLTAAASAIDLVDRAGYPVDLRTRARFTWRRDAYLGVFTINHTDGYRTAEGRSVDAWTGVDLHLRWSPTTAEGPLRGLAISANAQNLFDADPPFFDAPQNVGYDPANADPLGRFLSLQLTKTW